MSIPIFLISVVRALSHIMDLTQLVELRVVGVTLPEHDCQNMKVECKELGVARGRRVCTNITGQGCATVFRLHTHTHLYSREIYEGYAFSKKSYFS